MLFSLSVFDLRFFTLPFIFGRGGVTTQHYNHTQYRNGDGEGGGRLRNRVVVHGLNVLSFQRGGRQELRGRQGENGRRIRSGQSEKRLSKAYCS